MHYASRPTPTVGTWTLAILTFGIGDLATTLYFLSSGQLVESHPIAASILESTGLWILVPWKAAAIAVFYALYRLAPRQYRIGVPVGLTLIGTMITTWNLYLGLFLARPFGL
ncbi:hypothetical protein ACFQGT_00365 [Natrialbaceae archaeon GCM10025810]